MRDMMPNRSFILQVGDDQTRYWRRVSQLAKIDCIMRDFIRILTIIIVLYTSIKLD